MILCGNCGGALENPSLLVAVIGSVISLGAVCLAVIRLRVSSWFASLRDKRQ